jgi:hypothetical protein
MLRCGRLLVTVTVALMLRDADAKRLRPRQHAASGHRVLAADVLLDKRAEALDKCAAAGSIPARHRQAARQARPLHTCVQGLEFRVRGVGCGG